MKNLVTLVAILGVIIISIGRAGAETCEWRNKKTGQVEWVQDHACSVTEGNNLPTDGHPPYPTVTGLPECPGQWVSMGGSVLECHCPGGEPGYLINGQTICGLSPNRSVENQQSDDGDAFLQGLLGGIVGGMNGAVARGHRQVHTVPPGFTGAPQAGCNVANPYDRSVSVQTYMDCAVKQQQGFAPPAGATEATLRQSCADMARAGYGPGATMAYCRKYGY